jgi:hypothetical protein
MNAYLLAAAGLCVSGGVLHSVLGERLILSKLVSGSLPEVVGSSDLTLRVLRLFWHLVSVAWWGFAVLLILLASMPTAEENRRLLLAITVTFLASAVVSSTVSRGKHFSWGVLLLIAIMTWLGAG